MISRASRTLPLRSELGELLVGGGDGYRLWPVTGLDGVAGEIVCPVCVGSGVFLEPDDTPVQCTDCKGNGTQLVSL